MSKLQSSSTHRPRGGSAGVCMLFRLCAPEPYPISLPPIFYVTLRFAPPLSKLFWKFFLNKKNLGGMLEMCFLLASASFFCHQVAPLSFCLDMCSVEYTEVVLISFFGSPCDNVRAFLSFLRHFYCFGVVFIILASFLSSHCAYYLLILTFLFCFRAYCERCGGKLR